MFARLRQRAGKLITSAICSHRLRYQPQFETLEDRRLMAVAGDLDTSFSGDGLLTATFGATPGKAGIEAVVIQPIKNSHGQVVEEKILVAGGVLGAASSSYDFFLARYHADGTLDRSFGTGGVVVTDFAGGSDRASHLLITSQGQILAIGRAYSNGGLIDVGIARYTPDGVLDKNFGTKGKVTTQMMGGYPEITESPNAAVLDGDRLIIAGSTVGRNFDGFHYSNFVARYTANGSLDKTFGKSGKVVGGAGYYSHDSWSAVAKLGTDIIVVGMDNRNPTVARMDSKGAVLSKTPHAEAGGRVYFQPDVQKFITIGSVWSEATGHDIQVTRFLLNGSFDASFGQAGRVVTDLGASEQAAAAAYDAQGRIVVVGSAASSDGATGDGAFVVARYLATGALDPSFGTGGVVTTRFSSGNLEFDQAGQVAIQGDGRIVVGGGTQKWVNDVLVWPYDLILARYHGETTAAATAFAGPVAPAGLTLREETVLNLATPVGNLPASILPPQLEPARAAARAPFVDRAFTKFRIAASDARDLRLADAIEAIAAEATTGFDLSHAM